MQLVQSLIIIKIQEYTLHCRILFCDFGPKSFFMVVFEMPKVENQNNWRLYHKHVSSRRTHSNAFPQEICLVYGTAYECAFPQRTFPECVLPQSSIFPDSAFSKGKASTLLFWEGLFEANMLSRTLVLSKFLLRPVF